MVKLIYKTQKFFRTIVGGDKSKNLGHEGMKLLAAKITDPTISSVITGQIGRLNTLDDSISAGVVGK